VLEPELLDMPPLPAAAATVHSPLVGDVSLAWRLLPPPSPPPASSAPAGEPGHSERAAAAAAAAGAGAGTSAGAFAGGDIGGGWRLVRRVRAGPAWHPAVDRVSG
jgi:hypothetical protein